MFTALVVASAAVVDALQINYDVVDRGDGMLVAGRRGDVAEWPENTLQGIAAARDLGADGIEFDVRRSADGTFYLMHDATVDRTTDGSGAIAGLHDRAIDALTIDAGLGDGGQTGLHVPRLEAVLDALAAYNGLILLDGKGGPEEHPALARLLLAGGCPGGPGSTVTVPRRARRSARSGRS